MNRRSPTRPLLRRALRWGVVASLLMHAVLLAILLLASYRSWQYRQPLRVIAAGAAAADYRAPVEVAAVANMPAGEPPRPVVDARDVTGQMVKDKIAATVAENQQLSAGQQLASLERMSGRLDRLASNQSVEEVAGQLQNWLGLPSRAQQPDQAVAAGDFDFDTAQLHDVMRITTSQGSWQYQGVLLDAQGRTASVPLDAEQGATLYDLMQNIKANPLLERIYRGVAMPLLDQLVSATQAAAVPGAGTAPTCEP